MPDLLPCFALCVTVSQNEVHAPPVGDDAATGFFPQGGVRESSADYLIEHKHTSCAMARHPFKQTRRYGGNFGA